jgi:pimeloyl-ACP methyl ester carboxylesterase
MVIGLLAAVLVAAPAASAQGSKWDDEVDRVERKFERSQQSLASPLDLPPAPGIDPPGANDFSCEPSSKRPHPVVLVHGTFGDMTVSWNRISPALKREGYCVFALDYGRRATQRIQDSAEELKAFANRVRRATDANKVQLVGYSQGGMMPRHYIKFLGGRDKVEDLVGLSPSNHGTTNPFAPPAGDFGCRACVQQVRGSSFLKSLNAGDETPGKVAYTQVQTRHDGVVTPYQSAFLDDDGTRVTNVLLQRRCPGNTTDHLGIIYDGVALQWILNALKRDDRAANQGFRPNCAP